MPLDTDPEAGGEAPSPDEIRQAVYAAEDARQKAANLSMLHPPPGDPRSLVEQFLDRYQMPEAIAERHAAARAKIAPSQGVPALLAAPAAAAPTPAGPPPAAPVKPPQIVRLAPRVAAAREAPATATAVSAPAVSSVAPPTTAAEFLADPGRVAFLAQRAKKLQAAQDLANKNQRISDAANAGVKVSAAIEGKDPDKTLLEMNTNRAQQPVAQALQRQAAADAAMKDYGAQQEGDAKRVELKTTVESQIPGSPISQRGYMLALAQKLIPASYPASEFTESMRQQLMAGATIQQAREASQAQLAEAKARLGFDVQKETREARQGDQRLQLEGVRAQQDLSQKGRVPEQEGAKLATAQPALDAIDQLEEQFKKAGPLSPNENSKYEMMKSALAPIIVAGVAPSARETENLMEGFKKSAPGTLTRDSNGHVFFDGLRNSVRANNGAQVKLLQGGNYNPQQIAALSLPAAAPRVPVAGGGRVNLFDPAGKPVNLPASQVDAYLSANPGAKRAGP